MTLTQLSVELAQLQEHRRVVNQEVYRLQQLLKDTEWVEQKLRQVSEFATDLTYLQTDACAKIRKESADLGK